MEHQLQSSQQLQAASGDRKLLVLKQQEAALQGGKAADRQVQHPGSQRIDSLLLMKKACSNHEQQVLLSRFSQLLATLHTACSHVIQHARVPVIVWYQTVFEQQKC